MRYSVFPITDHKAWGHYLTQRGLFWTEKNITVELDKDINDWKSLDENVKDFIKHILAFFAVSDGVVNETIGDKLVVLLDSIELLMNANWQRSTEDIHNICYATAINTYIDDPQERIRLFDSIKNFECIRNKIEWLQSKLGGPEIPKVYDPAIEKLKKMYEAGNLRDIDIDKLFAKKTKPAKKVFINIIMEGIFFSSSFCSIFWLLNHLGKMKGLAKINEYISRDEWKHAEFWMYVYSLLKKKLSQMEVQELILEAVEVEMGFLREALKENLFGMNYDLMLQYVKYVADVQLSHMNYEKIFNVTNPFPFMEKQSVGIRSTDFFQDQDVTEYSNIPREENADDFSLDFGEIV